MYILNTRNRQLLRPALGERASFGTLYDARTDKFLPQSLLKNNSQISTNSSLPTSQSAEVSVNFLDSYQGKFDLMQIGVSLGTSILAGLVKPKGASAYVNEPQKGNDTLYAGIYHKVVSTREKFNVLHPLNQGAVDWESLEGLEATHFVAGIDHGTQSIFSIRHEVNDLEDRAAAEARFKSEILRFKATIETDITAEKPFQSLVDMPFKIVSYNDISTGDGSLTENLDDALSQLTLAPTQQIMYTLVPIDILDMFLESDEGLGATATSVNPETERRLIRLFDEFAWSQRKLYDHHEYLSQNDKYHSERLRKDIEWKIYHLETTLQSFGQQCADALVSVRGGKGIESLLEDLYNAYTSIKTSPVTLANSTDIQITKVKFVLEATRMGAMYVDNRDPVVNLISNKNVYVFSINDAALHESESWNGNVGLFQYLLEHQKPGTLYLVFDDEVLGDSPTCANISYYEKGEMISEDVLEEQNWLGKQCFVQYTADTLEIRDIQRPLKRRLITMPCPYRNCSRSRKCEWKCSKCRAPVEFGFTDKYIYCDCGRSLYENFRFKCNHSSHGDTFEKCPSHYVLSQLKNLGDSDNVNILILGETGVGKSTFINAFVNYLTFNTLDEAKAAEELNWLIPCSFSTQIMDRNGPGGTIQQIEVKVGARDDEQDGSKGASATQKTTVYPVTIGNRTIRLIDTPGIGDTRGIQFDQKNMADILSTLSSYDELHGVLILVKSNNSRLTVTFNFCMKELLTHLHRSAANNMAFGFTNTRISNYTPGDTFGPLSTLIQNHSDVGLSLTTHTTYCFDSESFRYLAAFKNGIVMENEEDFRRSWKHSRMESLRLVDYFKSKTPHKVKSTISLNGARQLIASLTKPMAEISALVKANIAVSEDKIKEMKDTRVSGENLRQRLHIERIHLRTKELDKPRTVCKDKACLELRDDGGGSIVTIYKTHCHPECYLTDVQQDQVAHPGLIRCAAFRGSNHCLSCGHHWQSHLHVLYEIEEYMAVVKDTEVERQLKANSDDVTLREATIERLSKLIDEYKAEHAVIQKASARFGVFLKKYSITPYNDATLEYLDMLIRDEEMKVHVGGSRKRLDDLLENRQAHEQLVDALTRNMDNKYELEYQVLNEAGVESLVSQMYGLKHFGENLQNIQSTISAAHQASYRERPFSVNKGWPSKIHRRETPASKGVPNTGKNLRALAPQPKNRRESRSVVRRFIEGFPSWHNKRHQQ
ncbi:hypothetical protein F5Y11DRAFT_181522 [Daldinia sp. FL1419]|nr:hypothetical protein F5Y11DRAFT_181522 [Daldinia sp. FL1419]